MAVTTTKTNKPINPRGDDKSPLAFNRAKIYSGKALDFDGVNDYVDLDGFTMAGNVATIVFQANFSNGAYILDINTQRFVVLNNATNGLGVYDSNAWSYYGHTDRAKVGFYAIVSDGTTQRAYYNGHQLGEDKTIVAIDWDSITEMALGSNNNGTGNFFDGQIAGFKIFNTALTAAQVLDLYNNPEKIVPTGVEDTALKLWLPMMEGAGTKCLDGASLHTATERVENGDFSNGTTGWVGNPDTTLVVTNGQLDIQSASGFTDYGAAFTEVNFTSGKYYLIQLDVISCDVPNHIRIGSTASAVGYAANIWGSGEIGIGSHSILWLAPSDYTYLSIGGRNDMTTLVVDNVSVKEISLGEISGATWVQGVGAPLAQTIVIDWNKRILDKTNEFLIPQGLTAGRDLLGNQFENVRKQYALNLDGNSRALVHDNASLDYTSAATLESWVYWTGEGDQGILGRWFSPDSQKSLMLYASDSNSVRVYYSNDGVASFNKEASQTLSVGNWYHFVTTYDGSTIKIYVNAVEGNSAAYSSDIYVSSKHVDIGTYQEDLNKAYNGQIAQPRIYNRALTADEVEQNYNAGKNTYS